MANPLYYETNYFADAANLAQDLLRAGLIEKEVVNQLTNFPPKVPNSVKHRYLFSEVYNATNNNKEAFMRMVQVLLQFQSSVATCDNVHIYPEHVPAIVEILAGYASKWRLIGTALRFQPQELNIIEDTNAGKTNLLKLSLIALLYAWVNREYKHTFTPTLRVLDQALNSATVGLGALACDVRKALTPDMVSEATDSYVVSSVHVHSLKATYQCQNVNHVQAIEGKSVLLEIQSTLDIKSDIQYVWQHENKAIIGSKPFMCLDNVEIEDDGHQYSCILKISKYEQSLLQHSELIQIKAVDVILDVHCPLDDLQNGLTSMYLDQPELPKDTWPPVSSKKYINLALIKQEAADYRKKITQFTVRGDLDDILKDKEMIKYEGIIKSLKSRNVLFIEGRPGSGKTTLVHRITHDWADNPKVYSRTIRALFLVPLRVFRNKPKLELSDILELFRGVTVDHQKLIEERDGKGVCFIFDGLDEFSPLDEKESIVFKIIGKEYLVQSIVIVASRPVATAHLRSKATKVVEVLGFQKQQIFEYFMHYPFSEENKAADLNEYLSFHPNIIHMCYLPIHAVIVAFLFEDKGEVPKTETKIYETLTNSIIMRNRLKKEEVTTSRDLTLSNEEKISFEQVCKLALQKTILNEQVLHQDEVNFKDTGAYLGLITIDHTASLYGLMNVYTFLHLTFQEYLAACRVAKLSYDEQMEIIRDHGHKNHMMIMWKLYCGLVKIKNNDERFKIILRETAKRNLHFQCAYESQQKTTCTQVLKSLKYHFQLVSEQNMSIPDFTGIGYVVSRSVIPPKLTMLRCNITPDTMHALAVESKDQSFEKIEVVESMDAGNDIIPAFTSTLSKFILF